MDGRSSLVTRQAASLAAILLVAACPPARAAEAPTLTRVALATSGMAWLGFHGSVEADGHVRLAIPADQLDDALKSLTVFGNDLAVRQVAIGGGGILADPFQGTPLQPDDLTDLASLLARLRGSAVTVGDDPPVRGQVVGTSTRQSVVDGAVVAIPVLLLSTKDGLASFDLDESTTVRLDDPDSSGALTNVLDRSARARNGERRTLDVATDATREKAVDLGLLVATPVWKPTWRIVLTHGGARIQGWAVVENRTGQPWKKVQLTLVDGDADTLHQALSQAWYAPRPDVPVLEESVGQPYLEGARQSAKTLASRAAAPRQMAAMDAQMESPPTPQASVVGASGSEADLATTFAIPAPVDVEDGGSLMVPLLDRDVAAKRIAFVPAGSAGPSPQSAILLDNDTGTTLPRGIVTVMDENDGQVATHVGDAILPTVPADAERRLSFGADRKIRYTADQDVRQELQALIVQDGVLTLTLAERRERSWRFSSEDDQPRSIEVEAPTEPGAVAIAPVDPKRDGANWYLSGDLPAGGAITVRLVTERPIEERFVLDASDALDTILASSGLAVPAAWKPKIAEISDLAGQKTAADRKLASLADERSAITAEQDRIRANLEAIKEAGPLRERWLGELGTQEDRLNALDDERIQATRQRNQAEQALRTLVTELRR